MEKGIIILAAGSSSRMGTSKQLLMVNGERMLTQTVKTALASRVKQIVVVLGAHEQEHRQAIAGLDVQIESNPGWLKGMGNSLKAGLNFLLKKTSALQGVVVLVCDQPFVTSDHVDKLIEHHHQSQKPIIASQYAGLLGVPAFFHHSFFSQLLSLKDEHGAKKIINENKDHVGIIDFPFGEIDLDTPDDYNCFRNHIFEK